MSAREDYPNPWGHWKEALDEIDRLREDQYLWIRAERRITDQSAMIVALDEMIVTLTTHADTMRELLEEAMFDANTRGTPIGDALAARYDQAITAYDNFMKELQ